MGGYEAMVQKYPTAIATSALLSNSTCNLPRDDYMHLFRDPVTGDLPWPGIVGVMLNSLWYWCADQVYTECCPSAAECCRVLPSAAECY